MIRKGKPRKKIQTILIEIESGRARDADLASLSKLLEQQSSEIPEVIGMLAGILKKENTNACNSAMMALNMVAEKDLDLVSNCLDDIMAWIRRGKNEFNEDCILESLDILTKISKKYPERMGTVVSDLIMCLENISPSVREKAYFLLMFLALIESRIFRGHSKEFVRVLNGLNIDERIYACRLIKKIAEKDTKIVESTYDVLEDLRLNHLNSNLRSEAAYALDKLKVKENIVKQKHSRSTNDLVKSEKDNTSGLVKANKKSSEKRKKIKVGYLVKDEPGALETPVPELADLIVIDKKGLREILKELELDHLISKKID